MKNYSNDFPMLKKDYTYLNSASTTFKPIQVIEEINNYYKNYSVNTNRGVDSLGYFVTEKYENVRNEVASFINANNNEIIFTRGTTESLNLVALTLGEKILKEDDEIIVSIHEHHSNFIPWQQLCKRKKAKFKIVPTKLDGTVDDKALEKMMNDKVKIVALNHVSNVFGSCNDLKTLASIIHKYNTYFVVDGAQGIVNHRIDVKDLDIDFYAFSGHKLYGPTGIGILYGKYQILDNLEPLYYGGEMIDEVSYENTTYKLPPYRFEAGTMMIAEVLGLGSAIKYIESIGQENIEKYVSDLRKYFVNKLKKNIPNIEIYNENSDSGIISFNIKGIHAHDVASLLDKNKIIVRAGHHCAEPLMRHLNLNSTLRISLGIYNTKNDCQKLIQVLENVGDYVNVLF